MIEGYLHYSRHAQTGAIHGIFGGHLRSQVSVLVLRGLQGYLVHMKLIWVGGELRLWEGNFE